MYCWCSCSVRCVASLQRQRTQDRQRVKRRYTVPLQAGHILRVSILRQRRQVKINASFLAQMKKFSLALKAERQKTKSDIILFRTEEEIEKYEEVFLAAGPMREKSQAMQKTTACLLAFTERTGIDPWLDKLEQHKWYVVLSVVTRERDAYIEDVQLDEGSSWPSVYDEEMKRCYLDSFRGITFESDETENYKIRFIDRLFPREIALP